MHAQVRRQARVTFKATARGARTAAVWVFARFSIKKMEPEWLRFGSIN
jgi:hypothetical protein